MSPFAPVWNGSPAVDEPGDDFTEMDEEIFFASLVTPPLTMYYM